MYIANAKYEVYHSIVRIKPKGIVLIRSLPAQTYDHISDLSYRLRLSSQNTSIYSTFDIYIYTINNTLNLRSRSSDHPDGT